MQITFDLLIDFWMPFSFWFLGTQVITNFYVFAFGFFSHKTTFFCFRFNIQYVGEKTQWFPSTWFLDWYWCHRHIRNIIYDYLWSRQYISINNILDILLVLIFTCMLIYLFYVVYTSALKIRPGEWWLVNTNSLHMIFKTWWLQHKLNHNFFG